MDAGDARDAHCRIRGEARWHGHMRAIFQLQRSAALALQVAGHRGDRACDTQATGNAAPTAAHGPNTSTIVVHQHVQARDR